MFGRGKLPCTKGTVEIDKGGRVLERDELWLQPSNGDQPQDLALQWGVRRGVCVCG